MARIRKGAGGAVVLNQPDACGNGGPAVLAASSGALHVCAVPCGVEGCEGKGGLLARTEAQMSALVVGKPVAILQPADLKLEVLVELSRMAREGAGGSCVLFRKAPEVAPEVETEIRRLCLLIHGSKQTRAVPAYCFDRNAADVLAEIVRGLAT